MKSHEIPIKSHEITIKPPLNHQFTRGFPWVSWRLLCMAPPSDGVKAMPKIDCNGKTGKANKPQSYENIL